MYSGIPELNIQKAEYLAVGTVTESLKLNEHEELKIFGILFLQEFKQRRSGIDQNCKDECSLQNKSRT